MIKTTERLHANSNYLEEGRFRHRMASTSEYLRGPDGARYDDGLDRLTVKLVVKGIKPKGLLKASNTEVHIKSDDQSMSCTIDIVDVDKKKKPPVKVVRESRFYEIPKFPGPIVNINFELKKDMCVLIIHKRDPANWGNDLSQFGL